MPLRGKVCLFVTIVLNSLLTQTLRVTARDADRWRILLKRDWLPTFCNAVFTVGNVALAVLIALSMMPAFGLTFSVVFAAVAVFVNGFCMWAVNFCLLLPLAHPVHGWHRRRRQEYDLTRAMEEVERLAGVDEREREREGKEVGV